MRVFISFLLLSFLLQIVIACKKNRMEEDPFWIGGHNPRKRIGGEWRLEKILINNIDSSIYLDIDSLNIIRELKFEEGFYPKGKESSAVFISFKRKNDLYFSDEVNPFEGQKDTIYNGTITGRNKFQGTMWKDERDVLYLNINRKYMTSNEDIDYETNYWFYLRSRLS